MMIHINDIQSPLEKPVSLSVLFQSRGLSITKGMAVAVNNKVIPREHWDRLDIQSGDKILIIKATQGG
jgi:sulfur carrier protein